MDSNLINERDGQLARYLHDGLAQTLYSIQLKTNKSQNLTDIEKIKKELSEIEKLMELSIAQTKKIILQLAPPRIVGNKFVDEIKNYLEKIKKVKNIDYEFVSKIPKFCTFDFSNEIMRIFLEALNNIQNHSRADRISVFLSINNSTGAQLVIKDNGVGFKPLKKNFKYGIKSMLLYAQKTGGIVAIKSNPGKGTVVELTIRKIKG
ncbi:MAG: histidine kinase [Elusimicrobiota bacterium]